MSGDEVAMLIFSALVAMVSWGAWYIGPTFVIHVGPRPAGSRLLQSAPIVAAALLWVVLRYASSLDVRDDPRLYLKTFSIAPTAPPAFLLDADRMLPPTPPSPGKFDNRWVVFPQDFPSATLLRARGVSDVLLIHTAKSVQEDLAHVLLRWQQGGLRLQQASPSDTSTRELAVTRPSWFRRAWYRALTASRLRRNNAGGFGAVIPVQSSGGGGRYYGYG